MPPRHPRKKPGALLTLKASSDGLETLLRSLAGPDGTSKPEALSEADWTALHEQADRLKHAARTLTRRAMRGQVEGGVIAGWTNRARVAVSMLQPLLVAKAAEMALDGNERVLLALLRGGGMLAESKPVSESERLVSTVVSAEASKMNTRDLRDRVLEMVRPAKEEAEE